MGKFKLDDKWMTEMAINTDLFQAMNIAMVSFVEPTRIMLIRKGKTLVLHVWQPKNIENESRASVMLLGSTLSSKRRGT